MEGKVKFPKELFDEHLYNSELTRLKGIVKNFDDAIAAIREEGIDVDWATLKEIASSDEAFAAYMRGLRDNYLQSFRCIPKAEVSRIKNVYQELADKVYPHLKTVKAVMELGLKVTVKKDGTPVVSKADVECRARETSTMYIDSDRMGQYYWKISLVVNAMEVLRQWEEANGLPEFSIRKKCYFTRRAGTEIVPAEMSFTDFLANPSPELFCQMMAGKLRVDNDEK